LDSGWTLTEFYRFKTGSGYHNKVNSSLTSWTVLKQLLWYTTLRQRISVDWTNWTYKPLTRSQMCTRSGFKDSYPAGCSTFWTNRIGSGLRFCSSFRQRWARIRTGSDWIRTEANFSRSQAKFLTSHHVHMHRVIFYIPNTLIKLIFWG